MGLAYTGHGSLCVIVALGLLGACDATGNVGSNAPEAGEGGGSGLSGAGEGGESGSDGGGDGGSRFDVGTPDVPDNCEPPTQVHCDHMDDDPWHALGLNCSGGPQVTGSFNGASRAMLVHEGMLGTSGIYPPKEGDKFVILSTGAADEIPRTPQDLLQDPQSSCSFLDVTDCPSTELPGHDYNELPAPIDVERVSASETCAEDAGLIGTGDCSNTLWAQWNAGEEWMQYRANDYAELRLETTVPERTYGIEYNVAFFSAEYPFLFLDPQVPQVWNDMYVAWLESEQWTGNISFDDEGNAISIRAVFLDYKDYPTSECPAPCEARELDGFAMDGHAGTKWLTTSAPVLPGEDITLVFAIFDLSDALYDSAVILDNVQWGCEGAPPVTVPVG